MVIFSDTIRTLIWFALCVIMALSMLAFAILFAGFSFISKRIAWKNISFPNLRIAK